MKILGHPFFLQFCVPLIAVCLSIFLKFVSRKDGHTSFRKEDLAVGLDLAVTALLLFITASSTIAQGLLKKPADIQLVEKAQAVPWILVAIVIGIWGMSTFVRKLGWEGDDRLRIFWGIVVPGIFGLSLLFFVVNWIIQ